MRSEKNKKLYLGNLLTNFALIWLTKSSHSDRYKGFPFQKLFELADKEMGKYVSQSTDSMEGNLWCVQLSDAEIDWPLAHGWHILPTECCDIQSRLIICLRSQKAWKV